MDDISPDEVRTALRGYFSDHQGIAEVRHNRDHFDENLLVTAGFDRQAWARLAEQVGVAGLGAPPAWGGVGLGPAHLIAAAEECGAALYPGPVRAVLSMAVGLTGNAPGDLPPGVADVVGAALTGQATVGMPTRDGGLDVRDGQVGGRADAVTHGGVADLVLAEVNTPDGPALAVVVTAAESRDQVTSVDIAIPLAHITFDCAPAALLTEPGDGVTLGRLRRLSSLLLAGEQVGGAQGCLNGMVEYATAREQFGKLIGTYQAIQHRCAQTAVAIASARALVGAAAQAHDAGDAAAAEQLALLAGAEAADSYSAASDALIQVSGGIGFTWEHDAHLHFRRARTTATLGGTPDRLRHRAVAAGCLDLLTGGAA